MRLPRTPVARRARAARAASLGINLEVSVSEAASAVKEMLSDQDAALEQVFGEYAVRCSRAYEYASSSSKAAKHSQKVLTLRRLGDLFGDFGVTPGLLTHAELRDIFRDSVAGPAKTKTKRGASKPYQPAGLDFDSFMVCVAQVAVALFCGPEWDKDYPTMESKLRLLLFWMDENSAMFRGNGDALVRLVEISARRMKPREGEENLPLVPVPSQLLDQLADAASQGSSGNSFSVALPPSARALGVTVSGNALPRIARLDEFLMQIFYVYCSYGRRSDVGKVERMGSQKFCRFVRDLGIISGRFSIARVDIIYKETISSSKKKKFSYDDFYSALAAVGAFKYPDLVLGRGSPVVIGNSRSEFAVPVGGCSIGHVETVAKAMCEKPEKILGPIVRAPALHYLLVRNVLPMVVGIDDCFAATAPDLFDLLASDAAAAAFHVDVEAVARLEVDEENENKTKKDSKAAKAREANVKVIRQESGGLSMSPLTVKSPAAPSTPPPSAANYKKLDRAIDELSDIVGTLKAATPTISSPALSSSPVSETMWKTPAKEWKATTTTTPPPRSMRIHRSGSIDLTVIDSPIRGSPVRTSKGEKPVEVLHMQIPAAVAVPVVSSEGEDDVVVGTSREEVLLDARMHVIRQHASGHIKAVLVTLSSPVEATGSGGKCFECIIDQVEGAAIFKRYDLEMPLDALPGYLSGLFGGVASGGISAFYSKLAASSTKLRFSTERHRDMFGLTFVCVDANDPAKPPRTAAPWSYPRLR